MDGAKGKTPIIPRDIKQKLQLTKSVDKHLSSDDPLEGVQTRRDFGHNLAIFYQHRLGDDSRSRNSNLPTRSDHDDKESMGSVEGWHQGWRRRHFHRNRR